jgi:amino acid transporter
MHELLYPFAGFAVLVSLAVLGFCVFEAATISAEEIRNAPRRARVAWQIGRIVIVACLTFVGTLLAWAVGRAIFGGW